LKKLEHETEDSVRIEPCFSPVWDSAIVMIALAESGLPSDHPALERAADWIMDREIRFRGDWANKNPARSTPADGSSSSTTSGTRTWTTRPWCLLALRKVPTRTRRGVTNVFRRGLEWMMTFQCRTAAGRPSTRIAPRAFSRKVPFADHNAMLDPECADITARILELLGYDNVSWTTRRCVTRCVSCGNGRKRTAPGTAGGGELHLRHLAGVARDARAQPQHESGLAAQGREWLESVQHEDGGWGERCNTYDDPVFKGQGPSTASQTAWAVMGSARVRRSLSSQRAAGHRVPGPHAERRRRWTELETTGTGFPKVFYLKYDMYRNTWPAPGAGDLSEIARPPAPGFRERLAGRAGTPTVQALTGDRRFRWRLARFGRSAAL
jgi:squalene-hopene/tetraprenyl-beta-curcumene cyclase